MRIKNGFIIAMLAITFFAFAPSYATTECCDDEQYWIQIGVFTQATNADKLYNTLNSKGFNTFKVTKNGKYYVNVGYFTSKTDATESNKVLINYGYAGIIKSSFLKGETVPSKSGEIVSEFNDLTVEDTEAYFRSTLNSNIEEDNFKIGNDVYLNGIFGNYVYYFNVDENYELEDGSFFMLKYSRSNLYEKPISTVTIEINGMPVYTNIMDQSGSGPHILKVPVNKSDLKNGFNEIKIRTYHRISEYICDDNINTGNWVRLHEASYFHLNYSEIKDSLSLKEYPYPYIKPYDNYAIDADIVIPTNPEKSEIESALMLAEEFGNKGRNSLTEVSIVNADDYAEKKNRNGIMVALKKNLPAKILEAIDSNLLENLSDRALIHELDMPCNPVYRLMVITSEDPAALKMAIRALSEESIASQMTGQSQYIDGNLVLPVLEGKNYERLTLEDLGYNNTSLEGVVKNSVSYNINIPDNMKLKEGAFVNFRIRYSNIIKFDKSSVTIKINDIPIGGRLLVADNSGGYEFRADIPAELLESKSFNILVHFTLDVDRDCEDVSFDPSIWGYVSNQSYIEMPSEPKTGYELSDYTAPFLLNGSIQPLMVSLSQVPNDTELNGLGNILAYIGKFSNQIGDIKVDYSLDDELRNGYNEIIFGTPSRNPYIKHLNEKLYLGYDAELTKFVSNDDINLVAGYGEQISTIQLLEKEDYFYQLVVTAPKDEFLRNAEIVLSDNKYISTLAGKISTIDDYGNINNYLAKKSNKDSDQEGNGDIDQVKKIEDDKPKMNENETNLFIIITFVVALSIMIIVFVVYRYKKYAINNDE